MTDSMYEHPSFYRMLHDGRGSDLPFYMRITEGRSRILELGVGSGRVALPLVRRGHRVVGVDLSAPMLASLAKTLTEGPPEQAQGLRLVEGDARALELGERFDAILCPFNGMAHHHGLEEFGAVLQRVRAHLEPEGIFAFDVSIPDPNSLLGSTSDVPWYRDPDDGGVRRATERIEYSPLTQVLTITTTTRSMEDDREPVEMVLALRQFFPMEMPLLLERHGFEIVERAQLGDVLGYVCRPS
ncbi:MAG: class I SAM-dependent methyltransferase [Myxococcota bacterium]